MKVQIIKPAFVYGHPKQPGDIVELEEGTKGSWFVVIDDKNPAKDMRKPAKKQETKALAEIGKSKPQTMIDLMAQPAEGDELA